MHINESEDWLDSCELIKGHLKSAEKIRKLTLNQTLQVVGYLLYRRNGTVLPFADWSHQTWVFLQRCI